MSRRSPLASEHVPGYCAEAYPSEYRLWSKGVKRSAAALVWLRHHGNVGLRFAAALLRHPNVVRRVSAQRFASAIQALVEKRASSIYHACSCGRFYSLETLPDYCPCGVGHFGSWARVNAKIKDAPAVGTQPPLNSRSRASSSTSSHDHSSEGELPKS